MTFDTCTRGIWSTFHSDHTQTGTREEPAVLPRFSQIRIPVSERIWINHLWSHLSAASDMIFFLPASGCLESWAFTRAVPGSAPGRRRSFPWRTLGRVGPKAQIFKRILLPKGAVRAQQGFPHAPKFWVSELCFQGGYWCYLIRVLVCFGIRLKYDKEALMCRLNMIKSVPKPCLLLSMDCSES